MTRDTGHRRIGASTPASHGAARRRARTPAVEPLEGRTLLSQFFAGPTPIRPVQSPSGLFLLTMNGPGVEKVKHLRGGAVALTLFGTTEASTLNVSLTKPRLHVAAAPLSIASIRVVSGILGGITAGAATLDGPVTPLNGGASTLQFAGIGPAAQLDVNGSVGNLAVGGITLGPKGHVRIAGDLQQSLSVGGPLTLDGGSFVIGHDLAGTLSVGGLNLSQGGSFLVGHDLSGGAVVNGNLSITGGGVLGVAHNLGGLNVTQSAQLDTGGQIIVGNDLVGALAVGGSFTLSNHALLNVGRDVTANTAGQGGIIVNGDLNVSGGEIVIGRNLDVVNGSTLTTALSASLSVNGNLTVTPGGSISVGGNLNGLAVGGVFRGNGSATPDLSVGLDLSNLVVTGGAPNQGGIQQVSIDVGKSILGLTAAHGIFDSLITAGLLINNVNIGADGNDAIVNSDIRAVVGINNFTANGNVRSTFVSNPKSPGYPTRIVAGENRQGEFSARGVINNLLVTGALIDSVIAASVQPNGGNGTLPPTTLAYGQQAATPSTAPGDLGFNTYDAPGGTTIVNGKAVPNWTELTYVKGIPVVSYDTLIDPTIDDFIFPGGVIQATILGGAVSTPHGNPVDSADFTGLFAADTRRVLVGSVPGA